MSSFEEKVWTVLITLAIANLMLALLVVLTEIVGELPWVVA